MGRVLNPRYLPLPLLQYLIVWAATLAGTQLTVTLTLLQCVLLWLVNRDTALTDDVDRGMLTVQTAVNETHPVDSSVAVAVHRKTELTDDVDRDIASAANTAAIDTELTRSLCKLIGVVYCDCKLLEQ